MTKVYLAGPINDCTVEEASSWRERWALRLTEMGYEYIDPFETKKSLRDAGVSTKNLDSYAISLGLITEHEIIYHSLAMTEMSDIVVLNFLDCRKNQIYTIGTVAELVFATMYQDLKGLPRKHTIVLANDINSTFFSLADMIMQSEEELFSYLEVVYQH
jgi:nucleoside 2-deoxyribosyltransferase